MVFEAAARLRSFTQAAEELGVTQAAVSRQIHLLEEALGFPLFKRLHRRIELTEKGRALSTASTGAFNILADSVAEITRRNTSEQLVISTTVSFSQLWLLPRVSSFSRAHPNIKLRIISQDKRVNAQSGEADLSIRYGHGTWPDGKAEFLFNDEVFPVCSPDYASAMGSISDPGDLLRYNLVSSDSDEPGWVGWSEWFSAFSIDVPTANFGMHTSFYMDSIHAALMGEGIALGWSRLVQRLLQEKRLVRITPYAMPTHDGYFIVVPRRRSERSDVSLFVNWIKDQARESAS
ncbi:LysR substrate-binding domain-containing protein [Tianweitania sp.]|uniref:LysR substrate-binding domain-containing protein n=1 Tax=Tianweitania sp. TaxID=2021634 RepID=UPI0028A2578E|nr:LysR substrate-binding domain-containing protein [Tianweitania sp.]